MLAVQEITKLSGLIAAKLPVLTGITSDSDYLEALELMEILVEHYDKNLVIIDALGSVINRYEDEAVQYEFFNARQTNVDPALATLRVLMDQHRLTMSDFEGEIGKKSMVSQLLSGKKNMTRVHITKLAARFNICPSLFFLNLGFDNCRV